MKIRNNWPDAELQESIAIQQLNTGIMNLVAHPDGPGPSGFCCYHPETGQPLTFLEFHNLHTLWVCIILEAEARLEGIACPSLSTSS
jgi:hypothetical protein